MYVVKVGAHFGRHPDVNSQLNYTYMYSRINLQKSVTRSGKRSQSPPRHNTKNFTAQQIQKKDNSTTWLITCAIINLVGVGYKWSLDSSCIYSDIALSRE